MKRMQIFTRQRRGEMSGRYGAGNPFSSRGTPRRLLRARRRLRAGLAQLFCALAGLALGLALPRVSGGPTVEGNRLSELLFTLGIGVIGVVSIVFALLFGVVQWSASSFSPRLNLFHGDPLVWRTFALAVGVFIFAMTAGVVSINLAEVTALVPVTAILATLVTFALIRALQIRAFLSLKLESVLEAVTSRGRAVIAAVYPMRADPKSATEPSSQLPELRRTVTWDGVPGVVQQLELRRLIHEARRADALVVFCVGVGDTVHDDSPLADIHGGELSDHVVRAAVVRSAERTFDQDPTLAFRLLADIALRAMSPSVNDPASAVDAIDATEGLLRALAKRELAVADMIDAAGDTRVRLVLPSWEDYLRIAVEDLLQFATPFTMVLDRLRRLLANVLEIWPASQAPLLQLQLQVNAALLAAQPQAPRE
ncbi:DUF2254 family protein [Arthrobacter sp. YAF17]|uniref:DUF2254 family protein n=1 Tax=Arthrobacter sp. YAF17 TaxID=3233077 RepID=UPI003F91F9B1